MPGSGTKGAGVGRVLKIVLCRLASRGDSLAFELRPGPHPSIMMASMVHLSLTSPSSWRHHRGSRSEHLQFQSSSLKRVSGEHNFWIELCNVRARNPWRPTGVVHGRGGLGQRRCIFHNVCHCGRRFALAQLRCNKQMQIEKQISCTIAIVLEE